MKKYAISREFFPWSLFAPPISEKFLALAVPHMKAPKSLWRDRSLDVTTHEITSYDGGKIECLFPVLFIMTSNAPEEFYTPDDYGRMISNYQNTLNSMVGPTKVMICGNTLQIKDYSKYDWTMFDPDAKKARHEAVFPMEREKHLLLAQKWSRIREAVDEHGTWPQTNNERSARTAQHISYSTCAK